MKKRLYIIDGHALCYRAYYAFINNPLRNSKGQNISAIFGFARMLLKLLNDQKPDYIIIAFDPPVKSFRFKLYAEYKAKRQKMPEDLKPQIEEIKNMLTILDIFQVEHDNFEADDILGTVAANFASRDIEVMLVTGDKDAYQLVNENVKIYANKKGIAEFEIYDSESITQKTGISPEQTIDYMALMGDSSDNIPGIPGVGQKTAQKLICQYGSLDNIYKNIKDIKGTKLRENIAQNKEMAYLSKDLVTIRTDVPIEVSLESITPAALKTKKSREYFTDLEMKTIVQELFNGEKFSKKKDEIKKYQTIKTEDEIKKIIAEIQKKGEVSIDTETTSVNPMEADLIGISLSIKEKEGWYVPIYSNNLFSEENIDSEHLLKLLTPMIEDDSVKKIGQNIKYDILVFKNSEINMKGIYFDTMIAAYLLNPNDNRFNMDDLAEKYLRYNTIHYEELVGKGKQTISITDVPLEKLSEYAIEDADITYRLYTIFKDKLKKNNLDDLFFNLEMPLVSVLALMEWNGVKIDISRFSKMASENQKMLDNVEKKIFELAGQKFNVNSTKELAVILFEKLGLKPVKKTKTGFSTDIRVLEALKNEHEIIGNLISYRTLSKLQNTYIKKLPKIISKRTGRIHTSYNQTVAATGRLSSSNPNLQNIPIKDELGKRIRSAFVPEKGNVLISADYSQIELRLAAHLSGDDNMIKAFKNGTDIHNLTASSVFNVALDSINPEMRRQSKIINFATIYGVSPYGLSQQAEIDIHDAADFINKYFETYPGFKKYIEKTIEFAKKNGYVKTLQGRRRDVPDIDSSVSFRREGAQRIAINTPIQGAAADLIKIAMFNIQKIIEAKKYKSRMILQVHDELVFEVPEEEKDTMLQMIKEEMENVLKLKVPIIVDIAIGNNWDEAH